MRLRDLGVFDKVNLEAIEKAAEKFRDGIATPMQDFAEAMASLNTAAELQLVTASQAKSAGDQLKQAFASERLQGIGRRQFGELDKSPLEIFGKTAELLNKMAKDGIITAEQSANELARARERASSSLMADLKTEKETGQFDLNAAKEFGSAAAYSAIVQGQVQRETPEQQEQKKQTLIQEQINQKIDAALRRLQPNQPVDIPAAS
jgi:hypothetical protein